MEAPVLTVGVDPDEVERRLGAGGLGCPQCAGRLTGWGYGQRGRSVVWPVWCCGRGGPVARLRSVTHVLLPVGCLVRRADAVDGDRCGVGGRRRGGGDTARSRPVWVGR